MSLPFGLLNLDKPAGLTSRDVVNIVQRLVKPAKAGHAGTLDPLATGVLIVCVGPATRLIAFAQAGRKVYRTTFRFGVTSETDDCEGTITPLPNAPRLTAAQISAVLPEFHGAIAQVPPAYSAVHVAGERAYELARRGERVELTARTVQVDRFALLRFDDATQELDAEIVCGAGTYIRSLGRDLAARLGSGAVMTALRRTAVGPCRVEDAIACDTLDRQTVQAHLLPPQTVLADFPAHNCTPAEVAAIQTGRAIACPVSFQLPTDASVALYAGSRLLAVAVFDEPSSTLRPKLVFPPSA